MLGIEGRRSYPQNLVEGCVKDFFRRLNRAVYKNAAIRAGKELGMVPVPGGDPLAGIFIHYHLLLEQPAGFDIPALEHLIDLHWYKVIQRLKSKARYAPRRITGKIWVEALLGDPDKYMRYITRNEAPALSYGIDKVDIRNLHLQPSHR